MASVVLEQAYNLDSWGRDRDVVRVLVDGIDDLLSSGGFVECDHLLVDADCDRMSSTAMVAILGITLAAKDRLTKRGDFYRRSLARLTDQRGEERARKLLAKYE